MNIIMNMNYKPSDLLKYFDTTLQFTFFKNIS